MRYSFVLWIFVLSAVVNADWFYATRPVDPLATETVQRGLAKSPTLRALVARLERSNIIAHVEMSRALPIGIAGFTRFVASRGGYRYVRIRVAADLSEEWRVAILAHELQHACEIAGSTADDVHSLRELFATTGHGDGQYFDTAAANQVEDIVRRELRGRTSNASLSYRPSQ